VSLPLNIVLAPSYRKAGVQSLKRNSRLYGIAPCQDVPLGLKMRYSRAPSLNFDGPQPVKYRLACLFALAATPALAVDPTGVPQCDVLLKRYEACSGELSQKQVHAAQKELLEGAMGMRAAGQDPKLRPDLERFCADTFERMKKESDIKDCMSKP